MPPCKHTFSSNIPVQVLTSMEKLCLPFPTSSTCIIIILLVHKSDLINLKLQKVQGFINGLEIQENMITTNVFEHLLWLVVLHIHTFTLVPWCINCGFYWKNSNSQVCCINFPRLQYEFNKNCILTTFNS